MVRMDDSVMQEEGKTWQAHSPYVRILRIFWSGEAVAASAWISTMQTRMQNRAGRRRRERKNMCEHSH
jgi:hypothetical protein